MLIVISMNMLMIDGISVAVGTICIIIDNRYCLWGGINQTRSSY